MSNYRVLGVFHKFKCSLIFLALTLKYRTFEFQSAYDGVIGLIKTNDALMDNNLSPVSLCGNNTKALHADRNSNGLRLSFF